MDGLDDLMRLGMMFSGNIFLFLGLFSIQYIGAFGWVIVGMGWVWQFISLFVLRKIVRWRAGLLHHIKSWFINRDPLATQGWVGQQIFKWQKHPLTFAKVRNFRAPDGHFDPVAYLTFLPLPRFWNKVRHPKYNQGGRIPGVVLVHPLQYDLQFREDEDTTSHSNYTVRVSTVSKAIFDEIQPEVINDLMGKAQHNLVPSVDDSMRHVPWLYTFWSSGTAINRPEGVQEVPKVPISVGPMALLTYSCMDKKEDGSLCAKPLGRPDSTGWATCPDGHRFYMGSIPK